MYVVHIDNTTPFPTPICDTVTPSSTFKRSFMNIYNAYEKEMHRTPT